jgi:hypothetical protein
MAEIQENFTIESGVKEVTILRGDAIIPHVPKAIFYV